MRLRCPEVLPPPASRMAIPPAPAAIHASKIRRAGGHIPTGPVAVAGAEPGDMLEVRIDKIALGDDWGYCGFAHWAERCRRTSPIAI
jgi:acetamidase/formamidase